MIRHIQYVLAGLILLGLSPRAFAGVTEIQALQFGEYIVTHNDAVYSITVNVGGVVTYDPAGFIEIAATGQDGIYDIDGLPASTAITSVVISQTTPLTSGGLSFQMNTFTESHPASTDGAGVAQIRVGATADTSGNGVPYLDRTYNGMLEIQINF
ncbi:MAG TPA: hypothetical protein PK513_04335 [Alphaproteobacteria bacterium]|nr:DUF4402 domain-containing protein [Alphaproteobacteria bacterium]USO04907.1 MAG: DUF4402 domain-containing protein [Rhodospirillales bacterium]HOO81709.1 hypothetical protein [Alphaproteobacteria bacterium]